MSELLVSMPQFKKALDLFIDETYSSKVPKSEYLFYFGKLAILNSLLSKNWARLADENGMVELNMFYEQYSKMFEKTNEISFQGFTMTKDDLNNLFGYIRAQLPNNGTNQNNNNNRR